MPWPTAFATCHGLPVTSPQANTPGTDAAHPASTAIVSSASGITSRSIAMSAADLAPSSTNTPSTGSDDPSSRVTPETLPSPSMDATVERTTSAPAATALPAAAADASVRGVHQ